MDYDIETIAGQFERIFNRYQALRRHPVPFDETTVLYRSELHLMDAIRMQENINVTKLSKSLGITKGAVSQFIEKLCKKDMVIKSPSPLTENEVILTLTDRGQRALKEHEAYHKSMYAAFDSILEQYPPETGRAVSELLACFETYLTKK